MTGEINVLSRTQQINVEPTSSAVSVINAGPQGPVGGSGPSGMTTFLDGAGPPSPALGVIDQYYLDTTNNVLYGPKAATTPIWPVALTGTVPILSGAGVPASSLGIDGQYYVDTVGKVTYGPRSTVTAPGEYATFTDGGTTAIGNTNDAGNKFTVNRDGYITGIRYRRAAANTAAMVLSLWNVSPGTAGTLLATVTDTHAAGVGWFIGVFATPVSVTAGQQVVASMTPSPGASWSAPTSGTLPVNPTSGSISFVDGRNHTGPGYPTSLVATNYISPVWTASLTTTGLWIPIIDPRYGVRVVWENDSATLGGATSEQTLASYLLPPPGVNPGGMKWVFTVHGLCSNTGAGAINLSLRAKINGTTQIGTSTIPVPNGTGERIFEIEWTLLGDNDYNLNQKAKFRVSGLMAPPTSTDDLVNRFGYTRGNSITAPTWADPLLLSVTAQWSSAATQTLDMHGYEVIYFATTPG